MTATVFDGNSFAAEKELKLKEKVAQFGKLLKLVSVVVGDDPASHLYVRLKGEAAQRIGIRFDKVEWHMANGTWQMEELIERIKSLNSDKSITGIMVQLPLPEEIRDKTEEVLDAIDPKKDVDCLTTANLKLIQDGQPKVLPATVKAVMSILSEAAYGIWQMANSGREDFLRGRKVVVIGRSRVLGRPLAAELQRLGGKVTVAHSQTEDLGNVTREAEVVVSATGQPRLITGDMVGEGAIVIDVGEPKGDVDFESVKKKAVFITPVPGGVGPMTVVSLLENLVEVATSTNHI